MTGDLIRIGKRCNNFILTVHLLKMELKITYQLHIFQRLQEFSKLLIINFSRPTAILPIINPALKGEGRITIHSAALTLGISFKTFRFYFTGIHLSVVPFFNYVFFVSINNNNYYDTNKTYIAYNTTPICNY